MPDKPKYSTVKRLYAMSGNVCAFPGCQEPLIHGDKVTGRICHIKGAKLGAARFDADQTSIERHGFENLILMCPRDHDIIDADEKTYTVERLVAMKKEHEKKLASKPPQLDDRLVEQFLAFLSAPPIQHRATIYNQNVTSYGQSGGITAHTVNMVPPRRKLGPKLKQQLRTELPRDQEIVIWFMAGNDESYSLANEIFVFLKAEGFKLLGDDAFGQMFASKPIQGVCRMPDEQGRINLQVGVA